MEANDPDVRQTEHPDAPGTESCIKVSVSGRYGFDDFHKMLKRIVGEMSDSIDVIYSAPARRLIQGPSTKGIMGVTIEKNGEVYDVLAKNGVVLATGGFENDQGMLQNYLPDVQRLRKRGRASTRETAFAWQWSAAPICGT